MKVGYVLEQKGVQSYSTTADQPLTRAAAVMTEQRIGSLVVTAEGRIESIVTERDVLFAVGRYQGEISALTVRDVMAPTLVTCSSDDTLDRVMDLMINNRTGHRIRHLPVVDNGELRGVISISDVVEALLTQVEFENKLLKNYIKNWPDANL
ncbi:MAG: Inosine-5'-monophosphate dehydrogenase [Halothiobacillaceae bacterium]|nr:MAG: Inosine-5'-monophosphate dehydrogenase [Halothiobacillaceae bacterium]